MTYPQTEIYPSTPLAMVAFELRIPHTLRLAERDAQIQVWELIKDRLPITQPEPAVQVTLGPGMMHAQGPLRMLNRGRTLGVVVGPEALVVETTRYRCFEEFRELLGYVLAALPVAEIAGFGRIGLRYINEVRVPDLLLPADWDSLVAEALLADVQITPTGLTAQSKRGEIEYVGLDGLRVLMRHGVASGRLVNADGPLQTQSKESGPCFFLDLDSYWENPPDCELPEFSSQAIIDKTTQLREPIHNLFESAITERSRELFRREPA